MLRQVSSKLDQRLVEMTDLPPVAWPNVAFTPNSEELYLSVMNMPADGVMYSMERFQNTPGVYRINIYSPANRGPALAEEMGDKIAAHFREQSNMGDGLFIEEINFSPAISDDVYYMLPMSINWRVYHGYA